MTTKGERRDAKRRARKDRAPGAATGAAYIGGPEKLFPRKIGNAIYREAARKIRKEFGK